MEHRHIPASKDGSIPSAKHAFGAERTISWKMYGMAAARSVVS